MALLLTAKVIYQAMRRWTTFNEWSTWTRMWTRHWKPSIWMVFELKATSFGLFWIILSGWKDIVSDLGFTGSILTIPIDHATQKGPQRRTKRLFATMDFQRIWRKNQSCNSQKMVKLHALVFYYPKPWKDVLNLENDDVNSNNRGWFWF